MPSAKLRVAETVVVRSPERDLVLTHAHAMRLPRISLASIAHDRHRGNGT